jgi:hypothetical protein
MNGNFKIDKCINKNSMIRSVISNKTKDKLNGYNSIKNTNNYSNNITMTNASISNESVSPSSTSTSSYTSSSATPPTYSANDHKPFNLSHQRLNNNFYLKNSITNTSRNEVLRMCNIFC